MCSSDLASAATETIELADASDFDPPPGDEEELPEEAGNAVDGSPTTAWVSEHYDTDTFGGLKDGVGLIVDAGEPVEAQQMLVQSEEGGWDGEVYAAESSPPDDLEGWGDPIGALSDASDDADITLEPAAPAQYYLLWFTRLPESTDDAGRFRAEINEIELQG